MERGGKHPRAEFLKYAIGLLGNENICGPVF